MKLKTLSIATGILFVISIVVFINENRRGTDLLSGSDYIKGLDVGKVQKMVLSFKTEKKITFTRDANRFVLEDHKSYPAASDKVNDLIYKIASIRVKEKILSNAEEDDLKKYELDKQSRPYLIELYDNDGKKTVAFRIGKTHKGKNRFLYKEGSKEVYLSQSNIYINTSHKDYINTKLFEIKKEEIEHITLLSDQKIELKKEENEFKVISPNKKFKKEKIDEYTNGLGHVSFEDYYSYGSNDVQSLVFNKDIKVHLTNKLVYKISLAKNKDNHFVKVNALVNEIPKKVVVHKDDGKDKLQKIEDMLKAQGEAQRINAEKGRWIYKVDQATYDKLIKKTTFFL